jgi:hypothetical protein
VPANSQARRSSFPKRELRRFTVSQVQRGSISHPRIAPIRSLPWGSTTERIVSHRTYAVPRDLVLDTHERRLGNKHLTVTGRELVVGV